MRPLSALLLLVFATAQAGLNTEGLPAGAVGIVGFDLVAFRATKVGQAVEKLADLNSKNLEASRKLNDKVGVDTAKDLHDLVVAIYPGPDGKVSETHATGVVLIRGSFDPARLATFAQANKIPGKTFGKHQAWEAGPFIEKIAGEKPKKSEDAYLVAHSSKLLVIAGADFLDRALEAADRAEKSAQLPADIAAKFASAPNSWLYLYADVSKMKNTKGDFGAQDFSLVLGENATDLQLAVATRFVSTEKASAALRLLTGLQAGAAIGLMRDDGKTPEEKANQAMLSDLLQKIRISGDDKTAKLDLDYPADKALQLIIKAAEQGKKAAPTAAK